MTVPYGTGKDRQTVRTGLTKRQTVMKIGQNKVVELAYELEVDGQTVDRCPEERPLDYIHGTRTLLEKFEKNIEGLEPGDGFRFTLTPEEGYGEIDPDRVIDLPKAAFEVNGELREDLMVVGNRIPLINKAGGVVPGIILEVSDDSVDCQGCHGKGTGRGAARGICPEQLRMPRRLRRSRRRPLPPR